MEIVKPEDLDKYNDEDYVWYACYGSNINYDRFMYYINGDLDEKYSSINGCVDKSKPVEEKKYIFKCPIYFSGESKKWGGGMAFLDYENSGNAYGKIYKVKMIQLKGVLEQEQQCKLYDTILIVDYVDNIPVFTFTTKHKLDDKLNQPSKAYIEVIKEGLLDLYDEISLNDIQEYLKNK